MRHAPVPRHRRAARASSTRASSRWGIVTNKATRFTERLVARARGSSRACVVCGDTTPHLKPHPGPLLLAAEQLGLAPAALLLPRRRPARHPGGARRRHAPGRGRVGLPSPRKRRARHLAGRRRDRPSPPTCFPYWRRHESHRAHHQGHFLARRYRAARTVARRARSAGARRSRVGQSGGLQDSERPTPPRRACSAGTPPAPSTPSAPRCTLFKPGDAVYYAGDVTRPGSQQRVPAGRRAHRRAQAEVARLRAGRGDSAHRDHRLGGVLRPAEGASRASRC